MVHSSGGSNKMLDHMVNSFTGAYIRARIEARDADARVGSETWDKGIFGEAPI